VKAEDPEAKNQGTEKECDSGLAVATDHGNECCQEEEVSEGFHRVGLNPFDG